MILGEWSKKYVINIGPAINPDDVKSIVIIYEHSMSRVNKEIDSVEYVSSRSGKL